MSLVYDLVAARTPPKDPSKAKYCMVLHGLGDSKEGWKAVAPMLGLDAMAFLFVQAPIPYFGGWSWFDIALGGAVRVDDDQIRAGRAALRELLNELETRRGIPCERLYLLGFSQGCLMVLDLALRHDRAFAGVVAISGFLSMRDEFPAALGAAAKQQRIFQTHGRFDGVVDFAAGQRVAGFLGGLGLDARFSAYDKDHGIDPEVEIPDIRAFLSR